jgi:hypothetical protein
MHLTKTPIAPETGVVDDVEICRRRNLPDVVDL